MQDLSTQGAPSLSSSPREAVLKEFGRTAATLPFDVNAVQSALVKVKEEGGDELEIEMCCTLAAFEGMTRVVDATIRKGPPELMLSILRGINNIVFHSRELMLAGSAIAGCRCCRGCGIQKGIML